MTYDLGVDLGTTYTAAAVSRDGRVDMLELGIRTNTVPSVVFAEADGTIVVGEAALRRAASAPDRVAREYKRRIGDQSPIVLGTHTYPAAELNVAMLRWVIEMVTEREAAGPRHLTLAFPANWGSYKREVLEEAIRAAGLDDVGLITEPEAAVVHYAAQARVASGSVIAVYDLGGGTFDSAIVRKTSTGVELLGQPEGIERLGGIDFDEAVFAHVVTALGPAMPDIGEADDLTLAAVARLRDECVRAKEALSADTEVSIPVLLPGIHTEVRLTRGEFEAMIRTPLATSIAALERAVRGADLTPDQLDAVLLVGGSSRIPLVSELVGAALGRPVMVDAHPKHAVALGAARTASGVGEVAVGAPDEAGDASDSGDLAVAAVVAPSESEPSVGAVGADAAAQEAVGEAGAPDSRGGVDEAAVTRLSPRVTGEPDARAGVLTEPVAAVPPPGPARVQRRWGWLAVAAVVVVAAIVGAIVALSSGGDGDSVAATEAGDGGDDGATDAAEGADGTDAGVVDPAPTATPTATSVPTATPEPTATPTPEPTATPTPEPTPTPTPEPVCVAEGGRCIEMTAVSLEGDGLVVDWVTTDFEPVVNGGFHAHFYWNVFESNQVGSNFADFGVERGQWSAVDAQPWSSLDNNVSLSNRPAEATEICVTVGTAVHAVDNPDEFHCLPIPEAA